MNATIDLIDALRSAVPIPSGYSRDDSAGQAIDYIPKTLYAFALPEQLQEDGDGSLDRDNFSIALELVVPSVEVDSEVVDRSTSIALADGVEAITDWVRDNRSDRTGSPSKWDDLQARVAWPGFRGMDFRGVQIQLSGYRYLS